MNYCKPVAKTYEDRRAIRKVIASGDKKFFLGSDSAPHVLGKKLPREVDHACAAGVYTSPILLPLVAHAFEAMEPVIPLDKLEGFVSGFGREFYRQPAEGKVRLRRTKATVQKEYEMGKEKVVPFKSGKGLGWEIVQ